VFKWPAHAVFLAFLGMGLLGGLGLEELASRASSGRGGARRFGWCAGILLAVLVGLLALELAMPAGPLQAWRDKWRAVPCRPANEFVNPARYPIWGEFARRVFLFIASGGTVIAAIRSRRPWVAWLLVALLCGDLLYFSQRRIRFSPVDVYGAAIETPKSISPGQGAGRVLQGPNMTRLNEILYANPDAKQFLRAKAALLGETHLIPGVEKVEGWNAMVSERSFSYYFAMVSQSSEPEQMLKLMQVAGVKYLMKVEGQDELELERVQIRELEDTLARAFVVHRAIYAKNKEEAAGRILKGEFDPAKEVVLEAAAGKWRDESEGADQRASVGWVSYETVGGWLAVRVRVESERPGFLVVTQSFYPGWEATVNGERREILAADYAFCAVPVDAGESEVELVYRPWSVRAGAMISLIGWVALGVYGAGWAGMRRRRKGARMSGAGSG